MLLDLVEFLIEVDLAVPGDRRGLGGAEILLVVNWAIRRLAAGSVESLRRSSTFQGALLRAYL